MKKNNMYNNNLYTFFCTDNTNNIKKTLELFDEIDVLYENGIFFNFAISKNNVYICNTLFNYFENIQFPIKNKNYEKAKVNLIKILENITSEMDLLPEMKKILSTYIYFEDSIDIDRLNDFDELDFIIPYTSYEVDENQKTLPLGDVIKFDSEIIS